MTGFFNSHSQIVMTFQPADMSVVIFCSSRFLFLPIFSSQNAVLDLGMTKSLHPLDRAKNIRLQRLLSYTLEVQYPVFLEGT